MGPRMNARGKSLGSMRKWGREDILQPGLQPEALGLAEAPGVPVENLDPLDQDHLREKRIAEER